jgi:hypothetical protein
MLSNERSCMLSNPPVRGAIETAIQALVNSSRLVHPQEGQTHAAHVDQHIGARYVERIHLLLTRFATHVFRVEKMSIAVSRRCDASAVASVVEACGVSSREVLRGVEEVSRSKSCLVVRSSLERSGEQRKLANEQRKLANEQRKRANVQMLEHAISAGMQK